MKLGICYMVFDGEELLEFAVKSIRNVIDYISVTYQDVSYFGNKADPNLLPYLENLKKEGLIDEILFYKTDLSIHHKQRRTWKELAAQKLYAWDFVFSNGDTIKDKMFDLFSKVSVLCVRSVANQIQTNVSCNKEMCAALTVSVVRDNIEFINKYEKLENGRMWAGQIKKSCENNGYCTDFDLYEDPRMEKDEITICIGKQTNVLKIFNYPFVE